jgi:hypothetical protein
MNIPKKISLIILEILNNFKNYIIEVSIDVFDTLFLTLEEKKKVNLHF